MILLPLCIVMIITILAMGNQGRLNSEPIKVVKVVIYDGENADPNCVLQLEKCLNESNNESITGNVKFVYKTATVINSETLSGNDVLIMPGSNQTTDYLNIDVIDADAIRKFTASGKGYIGICGGAYSAANFTDQWYAGWGLAPHIINEHPLEEENLTVQITHAGKQLFGYGGIIKMSHENGPAMYASGGDIVTFATYADNSIGYKGYAAIAGDYYGEGRTVLSGVHPELEPKHPEILAKLILWAANINASSSFINDL